MKKFILLLAIVLMVLVSNTSCDRSSTSSSNLPTALTSPSTVATTPNSPSTLPTTSKIENGLSILSYSSYTDIQGLFRIVGEVENRGGDNSEKNKVTATFYDEQGLPETRFSGYCYIEIMKPDDKSPFEIKCPSAPRLEGYSLTAEGQVTDMQPHVNMEVEQVEAAINSDGYDVVTGRVTNTDEKLIDIAMVVGSFYDSNGIIVNVSLTFCDRHRLNPNETAGFVILLDPNISFKISSRSLRALGYE